MHWHHFCRLQRKNRVYDFPDVIYGHIHMAKTAGSNLNIFLANNYERVCGNKGYSYSAYQDHERAKKITAGYSYRAYQEMRGRLEARSNHFHSIINQIGFEDCDFTSSEIGSDFWIQFNNFHSTTMELHLPCREPLDHLMSQFNARGKQFTCQENITDTALQKEVEKGFIFINKYSDNLKNLEHVNLKCYDFKHQYTGYLDYILSNLQPRRFVSDFNPRETETSPPRDKENECIWKDEALQQRVRDYLVTNVAYYRQCNECIGSDDDLTKDLA